MSLFNEIQEAASKAWDGPCLKFEPKMKILAQHAKVPPQNKLVDLETKLLALLNISSEEKQLLIDARNIRNSISHSDFKALERILLKRGYVVSYAPIQKLRFDIATQTFFLAGVVSSFNKRNIYESFLLLGHTIMPVQAKKVLQEAHDLLEDIISNKKYNMYQAKP